MLLKWGSVRISVKRLSPLLILSVLNLSTWHWSLLTLHAVADRWWIYLLRSQRNLSAICCNIVTNQNKFPGSVSRSRLTYCISQEHLLQELFLSPFYSSNLICTAHFYTVFHMDDVQWLSPAADVRSATCHWNHSWPLDNKIGLNLVLNYNALVYITHQEHFYWQNLYGFTWLYIAAHIKCCN